MSLFLGSLFYWSKCSFLYPAIVENYNFTLYFGLCGFEIFIHLFEKQKNVGYERQKERGRDEGTEIEREREYPFAGALLNCLQSLGLGQTEARS